VTDEIFVQPPNELIPMFFTLLGTTMFFKPVQPYTILFGTAVNDDGIYIADNPVSF
jgi:hypothetical protein